jgi:hypothetical protein
VDSDTIRRFLADPERLMAFSLAERELAEAAESRFRDPIAARVLRHSADAAQVLAGEAGGDWPKDTDCC